MHAFPMEAKKSIKSLETGFTESCEPPIRYLKKINPMFKMLNLRCLTPDIFVF